MKPFFVRMAVVATRGALKLKGLVLLSVLGALGLCVGGCPQPQPVYGVIVLYGPPYAMKADAAQSETLAVPDKPAAETPAQLADEE